MTLSQTYCFTQDQFHGNLPICTWMGHTTKQTTNANNWMTRDATVIIITAAVLLLSTTTIIIRSTLITTIRINWQNAVVLVTLATLSTCSSSSWAAMPPTCFWTVGTLIMSLRAHFTLADVHRLLSHLACFAETENRGYIIKIVPILFHCLLDDEFT